MKVTLGRVVIVKGVQSNGADEHPAIVNRVWSDRDTVDGPVTINATVFPDCGAPECKTSLLLYDNRAEWERAKATAIEQGAFFQPVGAFWPDRV